MFSSFFSSKKNTPSDTATNLTGVKRGERGAVTFFAATAGVVAMMSATSTPVLLSNFFEHTAATVSVENAEGEQARALTSAANFSPVQSVVSPSTVEVGDKAAWTISPVNPSDVNQDVAFVEGVVPVGVKLDTVSSSPGWGLEYSTNGGETWNISLPVGGLSEVTNVRANGSLPAAPSMRVQLESLEAPSTVQVSGAGDGFNVAFYKNTLWLANHHARAGDPTYGDWLKCFDRETGDPCAGGSYEGFTGGGTYISETVGEPFGQGEEVFDTPNASTVLINQTNGRIYVPVQKAGVGGETEVGWVCGDLNMKTSCGFTVAGVEGVPQDFGGVNLFTQFNPTQSLAPTLSGGLLYAVGGSGKVYCFDAAIGALCSGSGVFSTEDSIRMFDARHFVTTAALSGRVEGDTASVVATTSPVSPTEWVLQCVAYNNDNGCFGKKTLPNPFPNATSIAYSQPQPYYDTSGALQAICVLGAGQYDVSSVWECFTPNGEDFTPAEEAFEKVTPLGPATLSSRFTLTPAFDPNDVFSLMMYSRQIGERLYIPWVVWPNPGFSGSYNTVTCFDFSTNDACEGFIGPEEPYQTNIVYTMEQDDSDPRCLWWSGDRGRLQAFNALTGEESCPFTSLTEVPVAPESCAPMEENFYTNISIPALPQGVEASVRVYDKEGKLIDLPGGSTQTITTPSETVNISTLPISGTTSELDVEVRLFADIDIPVEGVDVVVGWNAVGAVLCAQVEVLPVCEAGNTVPLEGVLTLPNIPTVNTSTANLTVNRSADDCVLNIEKTINGERQPEAPGLVTAPNVPIVYGFAVSTPGSFSLGKPVVVDNNTTTDPGDDFNPTYTGGDVNKNDRLDPGEIWTYEYSTKTSSDLLTAENKATATAPGATNAPVTDVAFYTTQNNAIFIVKTTNDVTNPGELVADDNVTWEYEVTNVGPQILTSVTVFDTPEGEASCPQTTLTPGESMVCSIEGITVKGAYSNSGKAQGLDPQDGIVVATSDSGYTGLKPAIDVVKTINGQGNLDNSGIRYSTSIGEKLTFVFAVTNTGNAPLTDVKVVDTPNTEGDEPVSVSCPKTTLNVGEKMDCAGEGVAKKGTHDDTATATGTGTFTNGNVLKTRGGEEVPLVTDTSKAGYNASERPTPNPTPAPVPPNPNPNPGPDPGPNPAPNPAPNPGPNPGPNVNPANNSSTISGVNGDNLAITGGVPVNIGIIGLMLILVGATAILISTRVKG